MSLAKPAKSDLPALPKEASAIATYQGNDALESLSGDGRDDPDDGVEELASRQVESLEEEELPSMTPNPNVRRWYMIYIYIVGDASHDMWHQERKRAGYSFGQPMLLTSDKILPANPIKPVLNQAIRSRGDKAVLLPVIFPEIMQSLDARSALLAEILDRTAEGSFPVPVPQSVLELLQINLQEMTNGGYTLLRDEI